MFLITLFLILGCYKKEEICNGRNECDDGFDESDCGDPSVTQQDQTLRFRLSRYDARVKYPFKFYYQKIKFNYM